MASMRDIKRRRDSIQSTGQIPESIKETKELTADNEKALIAAIEEFKKTFIQ